MMVYTTATASWVFDTEGERVSVGDNAVLTIPDHSASGGWAIGGWFKVTNNTGTAYQYMLDWNYGANPAVYFYVSEDSQADPDEGKSAVRDAGADEKLLTSTTAPIVNNTWIHILMVADGTNITLYIDGSSAATSSSTLVDAIDAATSMYFGDRNDTPASRNFVGKMAEWAKWDTELTATEIDQLSGTNGQSLTAPNAIATAPAWYFAMDNDFSGNNYTSETGSLTGVRSGAGVAFDINDHPWSITSGTSIPVIYRHLDQMKKK